MKRIIASVLLLLAALVIPSPFTTELSPQAEPVTPTYNGSNHQDNLITQTQPGQSISASAACPCDPVDHNPTLTLTLIAAIAAWLAMASLIYGSHLSILTIKMGKRYLLRNF